MVTVWSQQVRARPRGRAVAICRAGRLGAREPGLTRPCRHSLLSAGLVLLTTDTWRTTAWTFVPAASRCNSVSHQQPGVVHGWFSPQRPPEPAQILTASRSRYNPVNLPGLRPCDREAGVERCCTWTSPAAGRHGRGLRFPETDRGTRLGGSRDAPSAPQSVTVQPESPTPRTVPTSSTPCLPASRVLDPLPSPPEGECRAVVWRETRRPWLHYQPT